MDRPWRYYAKWNVRQKKTNTVCLTYLLLFSRPVVSVSLQPHGLQRARPLCLLPSPKVGPSSCPLRWWCHPVILWCPLLPLPSIFPSIRVFSNESSDSSELVCIRWPKFWSFSSSVSPCDEYSGLISLQIDWFDLLAVQGTLRRPPAPHFEGIDSMVFCLLYGPPLTTVHDHWEDDSLDCMDLFWPSNVSAFQHNKFVIAFLPSSYHLPIFWLQLPSTVILEPRKRKSVTISTFPLLFAMK